MSIDFKKIKDLREKIKQFLQEHPEYQSLQDEVEELLKKAGNNPHNRCAMLQNFMLNKWLEIIPANEELKDTVREAERVVRND